MDIFLTCGGAGMRPVRIFPVAVVGLVVLSLASWASAQISIPGPGQGYQITKNESSQPAPSGYEGRTDTSTQTATGNTPATAGNRIVSNFRMENQVKTCPLADGTAEGEGVFSITVDSTVAQADGTSTTHIEMRAKAKYKGQAGDDAHLQSPANAEIDYSYTQSGTFRGTNGALATPAGSHIEQHITIPFIVGKDMSAPSFGAFAGGDPTQGHYSEAFATGTALTYWAGVYYSIAQVKWLDGKCVQVAFNPPSNTRQPVLGGQTKVAAEVKTMSGETVKANFLEAHAYSGGAVDPAGGPSDAGSPLQFTYTAPNKKTPNAGFGVAALSHAGAAVGEWRTGLGTNWSGQISCSRVTQGDEGHNDVQTWSSYEAMRITINVKDGAGEASGYAEVKHIRINKRQALRGGAIVLLDDTSDTTSGTLTSTVPVTVHATINKASGTYSINVNFARAMDFGKQHTVSCGADSCREYDTRLSVDAGFPGEIGGTLSDPNHLSGSKSDVRPGLGHSHNGTYTWTLTWDLARQGTTQ